MDAPTGRPSRLGVILLAVGVGVFATGLSLFEITFFGYGLGWSFWLGALALVGMPLLVATLSADLMARVANADAFTLILLTDITPQAIVSAGIRAALHRARPWIALAVGLSPALVIPPLFVVRWFGLDEVLLALAVLALGAAGLLALNRGALALGVYLGLRWRESPWLLPALAPLLGLLTLAFCALMVGIIGVGLGTPFALVFVLSDGWDVLIGIVPLALGGLFVLVAWYGAWAWWHDLALHTVENHLY